MYSHLFHNNLPCHIACVGTTIVAEMVSEFHRLEIPQHLNNLMTVGVLVLGVGVEVP